MLRDRPSTEQIALNRVTFGARDVDIQSVQRTGWEAWVADQLSPPEGDDPVLAQYLKAQTLHIEYPAYDFEGLKWPAVNEDRPLQYLAASRREMWRVDREVTFRAAIPEQGRPFDELGSAVYIRNTHSRYQLREFMADFWLNHFSISSFKGIVGRDQLIIYDRDVIRANVFGNFRQMLEAVATSVSMLKYLDNSESEAGQPNENYARELMELHTMGRDVYLGKTSNAPDFVLTATNVAGFTDEDILHASRAFSGWTVKQGQFGLNGPLEDTGEFVFNPAQHNPGAGRCLGVDLSTLTGLAQGQKVLDLVANHPATATFVCTKICRRIFGDTPPTAVVQRATAAWTANRDRPDQIKHVLRAILLDGPEIGTGPQVKVRRPHEKLIALARAIDARIVPDTIWAYLLRSVSDSPFCWPTPDGRPDTNDFWLNTATNVTTWSQLQYITYATYASVNFIDQTPKEALNSATQTVEYWVGRVIGYSLSGEAMDALINRVQRLKDGYSFDPKIYSTGFGIQFIAVLATAPEFVYR